MSERYDHVTDESPVDVRLAHLEAQVKRLADYILAETSGPTGDSGGACDTAIMLLKQRHTLDAATAASREALFEAVDASDVSLVLSAARAFRDACRAEDSR